MLEAHPVTQKALIGAGAFMFVFAAAMAGTGFMISGGFSLGDAQAESSGPSESYLRLARSGDNRLNRADQQNALESWARELRGATVATPVRDVALDNEVEQASLQPADISDSIVAQFQEQTSVAASDDGADQAAEEDDPFTEKS